MKRRRDQENETREMRKLLNDKDERIKLLDNEIKVGITQGFDFVAKTKVSSKFGVFNEILVLIFKPRISDYANREC